MTILLVAHLLWALWMIGGFLAAVAGYIRPGLWGHRILRSAHLVGIVVTATTPIWNRGICPLTEWEWSLTGHSGSGTAPEPFLVTAIRECLYVNLPPGLLSLATGIVAAGTLWIFLMHPPWRYDVSRRSRAPTPSRKP